MIQPCHELVSHTDPAMPKPRQHTTSAGGSAVTAQHRWGWAPMENYGSFLSPVPSFGVSFANTQGEGLRTFLKRHFAGNSFSFFSKLFPNSYMI